VGRLGRQEAEKELQVLRQELALSEKMRLALLCALEGDGDGLLPAAAHRRSGGSVCSPVNSAEMQHGVATEAERALAQLKRWRAQLPAAVRVSTPPLRRSPSAQTVQDSYSWQR
jgi:hypothetical protein